MKYIRNVDLELTRRLLLNSLPLLHNGIDFLEDTVIVVSHCKAGNSSRKYRSVRIPAWVYETRIHFCGKAYVHGGDRFATYYLAHELAHLASVRDDGHGKNFNEAFKSICPQELWWYELIYKPRSKKYLI